MAAVVVIGGAIGLIIWLTGSDSEDQAEGNNANAGTSQQQQAPGEGSASSAPESSAVPSDTGDSSSDDQAAAEELADKFVQAANDRDGATMKQLVTEPKNVDLSSVPPEVTYKLTGAPTISGDSGTVKLQATDGKQTQDLTLPLTKTEDGWLVDNKS